MGDSFWKSYEVRFEKRGFWFLLIMITKVTSFHAAVGLVLVFHSYSECLESWIDWMINNIFILYFVAPKVEEVVAKVEELKVEGMWFFSSLFITKGQYVSEQNFRAVTFPKKQTDKFVFYPVSPEVFKTRNQNSSFKYFRTVRIKNKFVSLLFGRS